MIPKEGETIAVWFSSGAASAVAAKKTLEIYGDRCKIRVINNPILEEDEDNLRFLKDVEKWIGVKIEFARHSKYPEASAEKVWDDVGYMSGVAGAPCTKFLKKGARQQWEAANHHDWLVMGFTADELKRAEMFSLTERSNFLPVLIHEGITKEGCFSVLRRAGIEIPRTYAVGWPNGNCPGCVKATSPTYWNFTRQQRPDVFASRAEQSRRIGAKLVRYQGKRIFLDELPEDAVGRPLKSMKMPECGLFCEEKGMFK